MGIGALALLVTLVGYVALRVTSKDWLEPRKQPRSQVFNQRYFESRTRDTSIRSGHVLGRSAADGCQWRGSVCLDPSRWRSPGSPFFGLHAMQFLPILTGPLGDRFSLNVRRVGVITFACAYSALTMMTFLQAINGEPCIN